MRSRVLPGDFHPITAYLLIEYKCILDALIDWIIEKNKAGYHMANSVTRLQEMKVFVRISSRLDLRRVGWYGLLSRSRLFQRVRTG